MPLPRRALFVNIFAKDLLTMTKTLLHTTYHMWHWDAMAVMVWRHVTYLCHDRMYNDYPIRNFGNYVFQHGDLDLWTSNSSEILSRSMPLPNSGSIGQTVQPWERSQTHRQMGPIPYPRPLTREGKIGQFGWPAYTVRKTPSNSPVCDIKIWPKL